MVGLQQATEPAPPVILVDLDGDGNDDMLIDEGKFACSTAASPTTALHSS